jgi:PKD repeat protein
MRIPNRINTRDAFTLTAPGTTHTVPTTGGDGTYNPGTSTGFLITFTDTSDNSPTTWAWQFKTSAGSVLGSANAQNPTFTFPALGSYEVTLTTNTGTITKTVTVR